MKLRAAAIVVGIAVAGWPALAPESTAKPAHKAAAAHKLAAHKTKAAAGKAAAHKGVAKTAPKGPPPAAIANVYSAMSQAERFAIQTDLVWAGGYERVGGGDFDGDAVDAVKAFQRRNNLKETGVLTAEERDQLTFAAKAPSAAVGWRMVEDAATGAHFGVPEKLVPRATASRNGSRWASAQGQIQIDTFRLTEAALPVLFEDEKKAAHRIVSSSVLKPDSFLISGVQGLKNFLVRSQARGSEVRGITILYDQATAGIMARVALATANSFAAFPDPGAGPLPGMKRMVEYGTAIVVSGNGDLIASAQVTDDCQAITVPGLGHAERVAADQTGDLALLRVYGARNLIPAVMGGASGQAGDVTVVGVADPLAQAGDRAVTSASARVTGQGVEPAPKPGFSGAAAVDAQGRLAGMVAVKAAVVAGGALATQQARLVPVEAIRTFLRAQGIAPATAGNADMAQSVVRVVCVRK